MSQHIVVKNEESKKFVFGWDQPLQSFFLQVHDLAIVDDEDEPDQIILWLGGTGSIMYEVEDLVRAARKNGLDIPYETRVQLYGEKDDGV